MTPQFNEWWNGETVIADNPYDVNTAVYWAWEGWKAAQATREADHEYAWRNVRTIEAAIARIVELEEEVVSYRTAMRDILAPDEDEKSVITSLPAPTLQSIITFLQKENRELIEQLAFMKRREREQTQSNHDSK